jgi:murein L,D-transpeptidase YafK
MKKATTIILLSVLCLLLIGLTYNLYPQTQLPQDVVIDSMMLTKSKRELSVYNHGRLLKVYPVALGKNPIGRKEVEGDKKTPEGVYKIATKTTASRYHKNLGISYPNEADIENARRLNMSPGSDIKIHGLQNGLGFIGRMQSLRDWTAGCIA